MKKPMLALALVALAGMAVGQATVSLVPIARWLGFYQRVDLSQIQMWTPITTTGLEEFVILPVTERIEVVRRYSAGDFMELVEIDSNGDFVGILLKTGYLYEPSFVNPIVVDPIMWGKKVGVRLRTTTLGEPGPTYSALLQYRTM
jgi:hypothetical protein